MWVWCVLWRVLRVCDVEDVEETEEDRDDCFLEEVDMIWP